MMKIKNTDSAKPEYKNLKEPNSELCLISLERIIDCADYGLCMDKNHKHYNEQKAKKYNTQLIKLFHYLCRKSWNEIYGMRKNQEYGYEHFPIKDFDINHIKEYFQKLGKDINKDKCDIFRFGAQEFRACGYRKANTFYLICIDYDFSLYNHGN
ncbi:hypothetical protein [Helicobacter sp. UBA3407]|uniref:hypothetical protein n=1 Tax=Helicobacter sp. UBA3407 TaxID=1946588 RepID=UPI002633F915|nr:hypothetical protein [Helicobacter sp. UBA3407]